MKVFLLVLFFGIANAEFCEAQTITLKGTITDNFLQTKVNNAKVILNKRVKENLNDDYRNKDIAIDSLVTDTSGVYSFIVNDTGLYKLEIIADLNSNQYDTLVFDAETIIIKTAYHSEFIELPKYKALVINNYFPTIYCPYKETVNLKVCPKCLKPDKICEIIYGFPDFPVDENGIIKEPIPCKLGGCAIRNCQPKKYCNRCEMEF